MSSILLLQENTKCILTYNSNHSEEINSYLSSQKLISTTTETAFCFFIVYLFCFDSVALAKQNI